MEEGRGAGGVVPVPCEKILRGALLKNGKGLGKGGAQIFNYEPAGLRVFCEKRKKRVRGGEKLFKYYRNVRLPSVSDEAVDLCINSLRIGIEGPGVRVGPGREPPPHPPPPPPQKGVPSAEVS